ncbi:MAG: hypothetical protein QOH56_448, partial [Pseudonocardiales bacterium]|nr:hypothetical protein [Pseudonocardiales bacterium]
MSGDHAHPHGHDHPHSHDHAHDSGGRAAGSVPADYADLTVPDGALEPKGLSRRRMLQGLG